MNAARQSEKIRAFFRTGQRRQYQKGEIILRAGEEPEGIYLIESGVVKIYVLNKQGSQHVTHFFGAGDLFPILWFLRKQPRRVYYEAVEPISLLLVSASDFSKLMESDKYIMEEVLEEMADRYMRYAGRIENLLYSDSRERCAYRLLSLGNRFGQDYGGDLLINVSITQQDMARSVNMTRETFGRCLSRFQQRGVIGYDDERHIVIKDMSALTKLIGRQDVEALWPGLIKYIRD